ncbi:hypothetical protein DFP72DRAFT_878543 [Ephemerocybe angulata]|uniref:Uncharacterized protein n=1 Tax=Ephemerocybe angulata TaxID=980116 RepID=A0A8H6IB81_9AGAR|nr:hypothetical protein DFP72DRAFT_878543 [Tulosesus angulatus]
MVFRTRNCYYLRISEKTVLPLYLYLDERHLDWMSDHVLQHVLSDLRPRILPKLQAELDTQGASSSAKNSKISTVDTHRGGHRPLHPLLAPRDPSRKRKEPPIAEAAVPKKKKLRTKKGKTSAEAMDEDGESSEGDDIFVSSESEEYEEGDEYGDEDPIEVDTPEDQPAVGTSTFDLEVEEEEKPKPVLQLKYQGFSIYGQCFCVVVEPWPLPPKEPKSINTALADKSRLSVPPRRPVRGNSSFLPDEEDAELEGPLFTMENNDSDDEDGDPFKGMMAFSQVLKNAGDNRPGAAADDEDMDSAALFGDADEVREL